MISHGKIGMPVLIRGHSIISKLEKESLQAPLKISITTFQFKDTVIHVEKNSGIEIDAEVIA